MAQPQVRPAAVAGSFYPSRPAELKRAIGSAFAAAATPKASRPPKALIVPHAGYEYSGPVAATGYATLRSGAVRANRVVILGPSHFVPVPGVATTGADVWETPLGRIPIDQDARELALTLPQCVVDDRAHGREHSLEVQLPFLQTVLDDFAVLPLAVGESEPAEVADVLDVVWGGPETLLAVSTDLSHYLNHEAATIRDARTAAAIVAGREEEIADLDACGAPALRGLMVAAVRHGLTTTLLDLRNSGDTTSGVDAVVGYGAFGLS